MYRQAAQTIPAYLLTLRAMLLAPRRVFRVPRAQPILSPDLTLGCSLAIAFATYALAGRPAHASLHPLVTIKPVLFCIMAACACLLVCALESIGLVLLTGESLHQTLVIHFGMLTYPAALVLPLCAVAAASHGVVLVQMPILALTGSLYIWALWNVCRTALHLRRVPSCLGVGWCFLAIAGVGLAAEFAVFPKLAV